MNLSKLEQSNRRWICCWINKKEVFCFTSSILFTNYCLFQLDNTELQVLIRKIVLLCNQWFNLTRVKINLYHILLISNVLHKGSPNYSDHKDLDVILTFIRFINSDIFIQNEINKSFSFFLELNQILHNKNWRQPCNTCKLGNY